MHLTPHEIQAVSDLESLGGHAVDGAALRHVAACDACRTALDRARSDRAVVADALELLDHPLVPATAEAVVARALRRERGRRRRRSTALAGSLLFAGAMAAAAMPGSPLHRLLVQRSVWPSARAVHASGEPAALAPLPVPVQQAGTSEAGIAFVPRDRVELVFESPEPRGHVRVVLASGESMRVTHQGGEAAYESRDQSITVNNRGSAADFTVVLPRGLAAATIRVAGRVVFARTGGVVRSDTAPDSTGSYVIPLTLAKE